MSAGSAAAGITGLPVHYPSTFQVESRSCAKHQVLAPWLKRVVDEEGNQAKAHACHRACYFDRCTGNHKCHFALEGPLLSLLPAVFTCFHCPKVFCVCVCVRACVLLPRIRCTQDYMDYTDRGAVEACACVSAGWLTLPFGERMRLQHSV